MTRMQTWTGMPDDHTEGDMRILAIDPGPVQSAWVIWDGKKIKAKKIESNDVFINVIPLLRFDADRCVIEQVRSYGMAVGATVFDTVFWSGRFYQAWPGKADMVPRMDVKMALCGSSRAKDANIRQALIDRFGPPGTKRQPGITYGVKADIWAALALGITWYDQNCAKQAVGRFESGNQ